MIAIIALLAALLFPALKTARLHAQTVVCAGNLRQIGVAIGAWTADHQGNFIGYARGGYSLRADGRIATWGGQSVTWYNQLGFYGYIGGLERYRWRHVNPAYAASGPVDHWRYRLVRCPAEPEWTEFNSLDTRPYTMWSQSYMGSSYAMNANISQLVKCNPDDFGFGSVCYWDSCAHYTGEFEEATTPCQAFGFHTLRGPGAAPANSLLIMDSAMYAGGSWDVQYFAAYWIGHLNAWYAPAAEPDAKVVLETEPWCLHPFHHPGRRANGLFYDGHVDGFRQLAEMPQAQRPGTWLW